MLLPAAIAAAQRNVSLAGGYLVGRKLRRRDLGSHRSVLGVHRHHAVTETTQELGGVLATRGRPLQVDLEGDGWVKQVGEHLESGPAADARSEFVPWLWRPTRSPYVAACTTEDREGGGTITGYIVSP